MGVIPYDFTAHDATKRNTVRSFDELIADLTEREWPLFADGTNQFKTFCPICEGDGSNSPSFSIGRGRDGRALFSCFKDDGCGLGGGSRSSRDIAATFTAFTVVEVPQAAGRFYKKRHRSQDPRRDGAVEVARYIYPNGRVKIRYEWPDNGWNKDFRWPHGKGGGSLLYQPPTSDEIAAFIVLLVEGEKDVDRLRQLGFIATTPSEGKLTRVLAREHLQGAEVAVLRDYDRHGRAAQVAALEALDGIAAVAYPIRLPGLREVESGGEDVSDWLDAGGTARKLRALLSAASERSSR